MTSKIQTRIQKLLAKAESTTNEAEAATFMAAAEDLMLAYSIERAQLQESNGKEREPIIRTEFDFTGAAASFWLSLGRHGTGYIVPATGLVQWAYRNPTRQIVLFGTETDCAHVRSVLEATWRTARARLDDWKKTDWTWRKLMELKDYNEAWKCEQDYIRGFCAGVAEKMRKSRDKVESSGEMVLVNRQKDIDTFMSRTPIRKVKNRATVRGLTGWMEGYGDGVSSSLSPEVSK